MNILRSKSACVEFQKIELYPGFQVQADAPLAQIDGRDLYEILITSTTGVKTVIGTSDGQVLCRGKTSFVTDFHGKCCTSMGDVFSFSFEGSGTRHIHPDGNVMMAEGNEVVGLDRYSFLHGNATEKSIFGDFSKVYLDAEGAKTMYIDKDGKQMRIGKKVFAGVGHSGYISDSLKEKFGICYLGSRDNDPEMVDSDGKVIRVDGHAIEGIEECHHPIGTYQVTFRNREGDCVVDGRCEPIYFNDHKFISIYKDLGEIKGFGYVTEFFVGRRGHDRVLIGGDEKQILGEGGSVVYLQNNTESLTDHLESLSCTFHGEVFLKITLSKDSYETSDMRLMRSDGTYLRISDKLVSSVYEAMNTSIGDVHKIQFSDTTTSYSYSTGEEVLFDGKRCNQMQNIGNGTLITLEDNTSFFIPKKPSTDGLKQRVGDSVNTTLPEED